MIFAYFFFIINDIKRDYFDFGMVFSFVDGYVPRRLFKVIFPARAGPVGRTGAVVSVADYGPGGPWFETWPRHSLLWP